MRSRDNPARTSGATGEPAPSTLSRSARSCTSIANRSRSSGFVYHGEKCRHGASVVRVSPDKTSNRLWVGFHFDRMLPQVQQEIETLVYGAA